MFDLSRRALTRPEVRKFLREFFREELTLSEELQKEYDLPERIKELSESQFMLLLQHNPDAWPVIEDYLKDMEKDDRKKKPDSELAKEWRARFRELLSDEKLLEVFRKFNDPLTPMRLDSANGGPGYRNAKVYANHQAIAGKETLPPSNLKAVLIDFIKGAEKELMFNVFDFDLLEVASAMIERADAGVEITGGIDASTIEGRPEVKKIFNLLNKHKNIKVVAVDSVGLNHQKIVIRDFNDEKKSTALFSSGNFTQSCIGPEGDLAQLPPSLRPRDSLPNANHMLVMDSYLAAQIAANSLIKTLVYKLRGEEYPLGGAYRILGETASGEKEPDWMVIAFSPKGGLGDINRDMTRRLILDTRGPLRLLQFAFSSESVRDAIIERAKVEGKDFDFKAVGDTPFAVRPWSVFLELAGYALEETGDTKRYVEAAAIALKEALGEKVYEAIRQNIRAAPRAYRGHTYRPADGGEAIQYNAKIHHKALISGILAVLGTSFNFSEAANHNQEQFIVTSDRALVAAMHGVFDGIFALTTASLVEEVIRRNELFLKGGEDELQIDKKYEHVDAEAQRGRRRKP